MAGCGVGFQGIFWLAFNNSGQADIRQRTMISVTGQNAVEENACTDARAAQTPLATAGGSEHVGKTPPETAGG